MANMLTVSGGRAIERQTAEKVVVYMVKKLMPRVRSLWIEVKLKDIKDGAYGYCMMGDNTRTYEIEIQKGLPLRDLVSTICHEMIHVKQYYRKEMNDELTASGRAKWKGRTVPKGTKYRDLPWEKEAFRNEDKYTDMIWKENIL